MFELEVLTFNFNNYGSNTHLFLTSDFYFGQNIQKLTPADWNYELVLVLTIPKTHHIEGQKQFLDGVLIKSGIVFMQMR